MKKIISLVLVALLLGTVSAFAGWELASPGIGDIMGQGKFPSDPHRIFRLVRYMPAQANDVAATLTADSIVIWDYTSDDGVTVTTTTTSYDSTVAGVIAVDALTPDTTADIGKSAADTVGKRNWTWLQTYGKAEVKVQKDCGTATAGDAMSCGSQAGQACDFLASASNARANGNAGFFYDTGAAAAVNVECFVICD